MAEQFQDKNQFIGNLVEDWIDKYTEYNTRIIKNLNIFTSVESNSVTDAID